MSTVVTVRYWAGARAAAGVECDVLDAAGLATVAAAVEAVVATRPALGPMARVCSFLLDGRRAGLDDRLNPGATLEVLPPFAGG